MRILVVQETDWVERNPILHHRMLESLAREGDEVTVVDFDIQWHTKARRPILQRRTTIRDCHKFFADADITVIRPATLRLPGLARPSWLIANIPELRRLFAEFRPDVVVAYSISNAFLALRLARKHGVPFVFHVLDALHTLAEPRALRPIARPIEQIVFRGADEVIVINQSLREYAVEMGARPERVHFLPMGVDRGVHEVDYEAVREKLGFDRQDVVLLFMGWLYRFSGLTELLHQLDRHRDRAPWLKLLVVGDGDLYQDLRRQRGALGLEEQVVLTGRRPVTEMPGYLAAADVGLLPARPIATMQRIVPAKVIEYMEMGKPVVATRLPGIQAEFGDLPGLLLVDGPDGVVDRVLDELSGTGDRRAAARRLGRSCSELMQRRPTWDQITVTFGEIVHHPRTGRSSSIAS